MMLVMQAKKPQAKRNKSAIFWRRGRFKCLSSGRGSTKREKSVKTWNNALMKAQGLKLMQTPGSDGIQNLLTGTQINTVTTMLWILKVTMNVPTIQIVLRVRLVSTAPDRTNMR